MTNPATTIAPVVKKVTVRLEPHAAFAAFTDEIGQWWPLATHSIARADAVGVSMEPRVGGQIVETAKDGTTVVWGTITAWAPPGRVAFTWHLDWAPEEATQVEVTFTATDDGATDVVLVHSGWGNRPDGAVARENYDPGWDFVLGKYLEGCGQSD